MVQEVMLHIIPDKKRKTAFALESRSSGGFYTLLCEWQQDHDDKNVMKSYGLNQWLRDT